MAGKITVLGVGRLLDLFGICTREHALADDQDTYRFPVDASKLQPIPHHDGKVYWLTKPSARPEPNDPGGPPVHEQQGAWQALPPSAGGAAW
jgi:hypothetical protein